MTSHLLTAVSDTANFRQLAQMTQVIVQLNVADVSHEDSLVQPRPAGNCLNWVLGHLLAVYNDVLPALGQQPVVARETLAHYARGSSAITDARDARPFGDLKHDWDAACTRIDVGLAALPAQRLEERVAQSPTGNPNETMGSLLATVMFTKRITRDSWASCAGSSASRVRSADGRALWDRRNEVRQPIAAWLAPAPTTSCRSASAMCGGPT